jgi:hypothetical protein
LPGGEFARGSDLIPEAGRRFNKAIKHPKPALVAAADIPSTRIRLFPGA